MLRHRFLLCIPSACRIFSAAGGFFLFFPDVSNKSDFLRQKIRFSPLFQNSKAYALPPLGIAIGSGKNTAYFFYFVHIRT